MSFNGKLIEFSSDGSNINFDNFSLGYIFKESYEVTPDRRQDLDSGRTANGLLKRNVLEHTATTISFSTKPMWGDQMDRMNKFLSSHFVLSSKHKKCKIRYYNPLKCDYSIGNFYLADVTYPVLRVEGKRILYNTTTLQFIEY